MENKQKYVLGFIFNQDLDKILLIKKDRNPEGLDFIGKINGVGGKIFDKESELEAIKRETEEETSLVLEKDTWVNFCNLEAKFGYVYCYYAVTDEIYYARKMESEELGIYDLIDTKQDDNNWFKFYPRVRNVDWMIVMALNKIQKLACCEKFEIKEVYD